MQQQKEKSEYNNQICGEEKEFLMKATTFQPIDTIRTNQSISNFDEKHANAIILNVAHQKMFFEM